MLILYEHYNGENIIFPLPLVPSLWDRLWIIIFLLRAVNDRVTLYPHPVSDTWLRVIV